MELSGVIKHKKVLNQLKKHAYDKLTHKAQEKMKPVENLSSAGKIQRVTGRVPSVRNIKEKGYWEPRDQLQPGSFGCFLEGGRVRTLGTSLGKLSAGKRSPVPVSGKTLHQGD